MAGGFHDQHGDLAKGLKHIGVEVDLGMESKFTNAMVLSVLRGSGSTTGRLFTSPHQNRFWRY